MMLQTVSFHTLIKSITLVMTLMLSACQTPPLDVVSSLDSAASFTQYQTIKIETMNDASHKIIGFMNRAIENHLEGKGYALGDKPDLIVVYQVSLDRGQKVTIEQIPAKGRVYTRPLLEAVNEAKILVNAYDPAIDKVVWKASTTRDVTNVDASKIDQERVNLRVSEIFESFPARH